MDINYKDIEKLTRNLKETSRAAYPLTVRSTLNAQAKQTSDLYKKEVPKHFTVRNRGYLKTIGFNQCQNTFNIDEMESAAGQREEFFGKKQEGLRKQEFGETIKSKSKYNWDMFAQPTAITPTREPWIPNSSTASATIRSRWTSLFHVTLAT